MTDTTPVLDRVETPQLAEPGDHERFAHYVRKADIARAAVEGVPAIALCGKQWVPNRDPAHFPVCPACREVWESLNPGDSDD